MKENIFHSVVFSKKPQRLKKILQTNSSCIKMLNTPECDGETLLHYSILLKDRASFDLFIELGADVDILDSQGCSPLHLACLINFDDENDNLHIVKTLFKHGANPLLKTNFGDYPLTLAINNDLYHVAKFLWECQASNKNIFYS